MGNIFQTKNKPSFTLLSLLVIVVCFGFLLQDGAMVEGNLWRRSTLNGCNVTDPCIKIGFTYSGTGSLSTEGSETRNGYLLWAERVNQQGGLSFTNGTKHKLDLIYYDDQSVPNTAASLYNTLINTDGVDFVLGPYSSSITQQE